MLENFIVLFGNHLAVVWRALVPWFPVLAIALLVELLRPGRKLRWQSVVPNLVYLPLALALSGVFVSPLISKLSTITPHDLLGLGNALHAPLGAALLGLVYLVLFDFFYYWFHRAQHKFPVLWRFHMVHHSDKNTSALSVGRHHWAEEALRYFFITAPLIVIVGSAGNMPYWVTAFVILNGIFMHWNTPMRFGVFERLVITPSYHRIHHSIEAQHFDKNFGVFTQCWDRVFKTRYVPEKNTFPETGIPNFPERNTLALLLPWPVVLWR